MQLLPLRIASFSWLLGLLIVISTVRSIAVEPPIYPVREWQVNQPGEVSLSAAKLSEMSEYIGGIGCVVRHGYLVHTWGDAARRTEIASCCKPWYAHFLFTAIEDGKLKSLDELVVEVAPRLAELNPSRQHKDRDIRWRHLVTQTSCYGVSERPGEAFDYSDYNMALLFDNLFLKVYGATIDNVTTNVLHGQLTDVLMCQDEPRLNAKGRLAVSPRDFARFGLLYLRGGNWRGEQLISAKNVHAILNSPLPATLPRTAGQPAEMLPGQRSIGGGSNQTDHHGSYSFTWWTNGLDRNAQRHWPGIPKDTVGAFGNKGKRALVLVPSLDLIVVWNDSAIDSPAREARALQLLVDAVSD